MARSENRRPGKGIGLTAPMTYVVLIVLALVYIFPFLVQVANSFKSDEEATSAGLALWSSSWTSAAFTTLFANSNFALWTMNSFIVTVSVTLGRVFFVSLGGYALARLRFRGRSAIFALVIAVMAVPALVLLIPKFLVIKSLGIYDTYPGMILPLSWTRRGSS